MAKKLVITEKAYILTDTRTGKRTQIYYDKKGVRHERRLPSVPVPKKKHRAKKRDSRSFLFLR